jgi:hypothetical protein
MKRSKINQAIDDAIEFCREMNFHLPVWACWTPEDWATIGHEADEIRRRQLGWDITDFGGDDGRRNRLILFTIRNGELTDAPDLFVKDYCEKILIVGEREVTPTHFHWNKMEDIINRAGGRLVLQLWNADRDTEELDTDSEVVVSIDGMRRHIKPGGKVVLQPGESITLEPYVYHCFYAEDGGGTVLGGEVSRVNDDANDNRFHKPRKRFPEIEEDQPARYLLCNEYPPAKG